MRASPTVVLTLLLASPAFAIEDDFLDSEAPCFTWEMPPELYGPLRASGTHRACLRTEAAISGTIQQGPAFTGSAFFSWRSRKRAEAFVSFDQPGPLRFGIAFQAPLELDQLALSFNMQALLPTFGVNRRAGGSAGVEALYTFSRWAIHAHAAVTPGFYERADDGAWLFGTALDATVGASATMWRFFSLTAEVRVTAGHQAQLRGALGARFTTRFVYLELSGLTPAFGRPLGFEGVLTISVQPFEHIRWPNTRRSYDYDSDDQSA
ncbi:MAG: hypothetical protein JNK82_08900 [Myxococcaceae bacterium]|nr:hypothetical protein [Myxococcaceae bacterium]